MFIELFLSKIEFEFIYTDGSKCGEKVGSAMVHKNDIRAYHLPDNTSVYVAELFAILQALKYIKLKSLKKVFICTDSLSALMALRSGEMSFFVTTIRELYNKLHQHNFDIQFLWVPSHVGITGNEHADREAKSAIALENTTPVKLSPKQYFSNIRRAVVKKYGDMWENLNIYNHLKLIKISCEKWDIREKRREEVIMTRLRIGHTRLTHSYIIEKKDKPKCVQCDTYLSVRHILLECNIYTIHRIPLRRICTRHNADFSLKSLLGNDLEFGDAVLKFLRDVDLYDKI